MTLWFSILFIPIFLCWGSFLNVVAYRLIEGLSLLKPRSFCPTCKHKLAWYDLIPIFSYIQLRGSCRYCKNPISLLYLLIESLTALILWLIIYLIPFHYWFAYIIFSSALIVNIRTDLERLVIPTITSLYLVPIGWLLSWFKLLPLTLLESFLGSIIGYTILFVIAKIFYFFTKKEGLGSGDFDLLALIGAFMGPLGIWLSLLIGSIAGSIIGITLIIAGINSRSSKIPFGPFLSLGAFIALFYMHILLN